MPIAVDIDSLRPAVNSKVKPAVADDYMYEFDHPVELPTIDRLGTKLEANINPTRIANQFLDQLARATTAEKTGDIKLSDLFLEDG